MLKSSLCDHSDGWTFVKRTIAIIGARKDVAGIQSDERNKQVIFKNCLPFTDCTSETNNTKIDNARDLHVVIPIINLTEYSNIPKKILGGLLHFCRKKPNATIADSKLFKFKGYRSNPTFKILK